MTNPRLYKLVMAFLCATVVLFVLGQFLAQKREAEQILPPAIKLKWFQGKNPPFNFTFEYPEAWRAGERGYRGDYDMVEVIGTAEKNSPLLPGIFITKKAQVNGVAPQSLMEEWLKTERRYKNFKILSSKKVKVAEQNGLTTEYAYTVSLPLWSSQAREMTVRKEQVVFVEEGSSFQITFMGTDEQYKIYQPFFRHVLKTFKFLDR